MPKAILFTGSARRQLRDLPVDIRLRIEAKLSAYAEGEAADVTALQGVQGARIRVGDYRVIFVERDRGIEVIAVGHRRDIYRR